MCGLLHGSIAVCAAKRAGVQPVALRKLRTKWLWSKKAQIGGDLADGVTAFAQQRLCTFEPTTAQVFHRAGTDRITKHAREMEAAHAGGFRQMRPR